MFIAIPAILKETIIDVSPNNHRVQATLLAMNAEIFLIVNTYFPTDTRNNIAADDIQSALEAIDTVIENSNVTKVFFTGDINCNFMKHSICVSYARVEICHGICFMWI